jgi:hypothetical protein
MSVFTSVLRWFDCAKEDVEILIKIKKPSRLSFVIIGDNEFYEQQF